MMTEVLGFTGVIDDKQTMHRFWHRHILRGRLSVLRHMAISKRWPFWKY
jgi:hypothetical protein